MRKETFETVVALPPSGVTPEQLKKLRSECIDVQRRAYCPYSKFHVGSAVLTASDEVFVGANVENASYPAGICAERTALCTAVVAGHREFKAVMVITDSPSCASPCGVCRQFISEFGLGITVLMLNAAADRVVVGSISELLPLSFSQDHL